MILAFGILCLVIRGIYLLWTAPKRAALQREARYIMENPDEFLPKERK